MSKGSTKEKKNFCDDATNIQAVIATYYNGVTVGNTAFLLVSLGLPNTAVWPKLHYKYCAELAVTIGKKARG